MKAIDINARLGANTRAFQRKGVQVIASQIKDPEMASVYTQNNNVPAYASIKKLPLEEGYDILLMQPHSNLNNTRKEIKKILKKSRPKLIFISTNHDILTNFRTRMNTKKVIEYIEDEQGYTIAGVPQKNGNYTFKKENLTTNTREFGLPLFDENTFLIAFDKERYPELTKIRTWKIPQRRYPYQQKYNIATIREILERNVSTPQYYLSTHELSRYKTIEKKKYYKTLNIVEEDEECISMIPLRKSDKFANITQDNKFAVGHKSNEIDRTHKINEQGYRYLTIVEYARLQGFKYYAYMDDQGTDHFQMPSNHMTSLDHLGLPLDPIPNTNDYLWYVDSPNIPTVEYMATKYIKKLEGMEHAI